jgi:hypothetical protein
MRGAQSRLGGGLFEAVTRARRVIVADPTWPDHAQAMLDGIAAAPGALAIDVPRLRCVPGGGQHIPAAAPVYYAHRDTWYANPKAQINAWIPLHDVDEAVTFEIFPEAFDRAVENDSERFDLEDWEANIGFQNPSPPVDAYPRARGSGWGPPLRFDARAGEILLFAAAHLHATRPHAREEARFSTDFRFVHLDDHHAGLGAPDPDNRSRGSTLASYRVRG